MARLKSEHGTEIEVPDELARTFEADGWKGADDGGDGGRRRSPARKKSSES